MNRIGLAAAHLGTSAFRFVRHYAIAVALLGLAAVLSIASKHFLTGANLVNTLESGAIYGIVAIALTLLLIAGDFDLCAGATFVLAGIVAVKLQPALGAAPALLAGVAAGTLVGFHAEWAVRAVFVPRANHSTALVPGAGIGYSRASEGQEGGDENAQ